MTLRTLDDMRSQIPMLSESERAELARELILSLDSPRDEAVAGAWHAEIERRALQVKPEMPR